MNYLVQHQELNTLERDLSSLHEIQQSPGSGHQDVAASVKDLQLLEDTGPAVHVGHEDV